MMVGWLNYRFAIFRYTELRAQGDEHSGALASD